MMPLNEKKKSWENKEVLAFYVINVLKLASLEKLLLPLKWRLYALFERQGIMKSPLKFYCMYNLEKIVANLIENTSGAYLNMPR